MKDSIKEILTGNHLNKMFKMYLVARQILKVKAYIKGTLTSEIKSPKLTHFWSFVGGGRFVGGKKCLPTTYLIIS